MITARTLHVGLHVSDLDRSLAFYGTVGYQVVGRVRTSSIGELAMLKLVHDEYVTLELVHDPDRRPAAGDSHLSHLVIGVAPMASAVAELRAAGLDVPDPTSPDGREDFLTTIVLDPDGNRIELVQWPDGHPPGMSAADFPE